MLKEFYSYLSDKIIEYMKQTQDIDGYKYSIMFENNEEVQGLYNHLKTMDRARSFNYYNDGVEVYKSFYLEIDGKKLIVAATMNGVQTDFITRLRNKIGTNEQGFDEAGLLIIYDSALDSIDNATQSFQKEGMPFHVQSIGKDISRILEDSTMSLMDQEVITYELNRRKSDTYKDSTSLFEYKELLAAIHAGVIKESEYKEFRLFYDPKLGDCQKPKDIQKRLQENNHYFEKIDQTIRFGDVEKDLDSIFTEKLIAKVKKDDWEHEILFTEVADAVDEKKKVEDIQVKQIEVYINDVLVKENVDYCIRSLGSAKIQRRNKDILIFNPSREGEVKVHIILTKGADRSSIKGLVMPNVKAISSRKIEVVLPVQTHRCTFEAIQAKDGEGNSKIKVNLCVVGVPKSYLEPLFTTYTINAKKKQEQCYICTNNEAEQMVLNPKGESQEELMLKSNESYEVGGEKRLLMTKSEGLIEEDGKPALVVLDIDGHKLPLGINDDAKKITVMTGLNAWKAKMEKQYSLKYVGENRILHGTCEYYARDEFKENLELEAKIIETGGLCWQMNQGEIQEVELEMIPEIKEAFLKLMAYYKEEQLLPSLAYYDPQLMALSKDYVKTIIEATRDIEDGKTLSRALQNMMRIGVIYSDDATRQIRFTPLAPINVAYQLELCVHVDEELLKEESLVKKLSHTALLPYIKDEYKELYKPVDQWHSPEWTYFVPNEMKRYKGSRSFVSKLVKEKIEEFVKHFSYLFEHHTAQIKMNLVNTGDCKEILQGISAYYIDCLKADVKIEALNPIQVNIYNEQGITHIFEEFSNYVDLEEIKAKFEINLDTYDRYSQREVVGALRENVKFYDKSIKADTYEYAHITFIEMNQKSDTGIGNMSEISTGVSLNGMISGVPSVHYSESYRTGFGTKQIEDGNELVQLAELLNSISRVFGTSDPYYKDQCITTELDKRDEANLEKVYNASNWVTFIQPKVDLNFFKTDEQSKDLLIIHYSDQYSTASGYDAITVTRKSRQYQSIIEEYLKQKGVQDAEQYTPRIINMFNAVNGDWLLRLISSRSYFDKEKISILSAIKLALAYFDHKDILWVPISLEEILRVSGGAGLKKNEGFFSAQNLGFAKGATSDDLMLVGIEQKDGDVQVHYYPIEVKIGINANNYIQKAITQVKQTSQIFKETLLQEADHFKTKIYRNFMMQLIIVSIEKMKLYNIWPEQDWDRVLESDIRRKLLNEEYTISQALEAQIGIGGVVSFKKELQFRQVIREEDVTILEFTEEDGINYITKGISEIEELIHNQYHDLNKEMFLSHRYNSRVTPVPTPVEEVPLAVVEKPIEYAPVEPTVAVEPLEVEVGKTSMEVLFGTNQSNGQPVVWSPNDTDQVFHTNTGIIGTMGTGKTQFTKSLITQLYRESKHNLEGKPLGILIFDYKGDYNEDKQDFLDATGATVYKLHHLPFNPLSIVKGTHPRPMLPLHMASNLKETLAKAFNLGPVQSNMLKEIIMDAYMEKGIRKGDMSTWDRTPPTMEDVYRCYMAREDVKQDSLYAAFSSIIDFEIFEPDPDKTVPLFDLINGVTVIDLSGGYDESVQNLVVAITLDLFYSQMQTLGHSKIQGNIRQLSKMILVDEADNFLSKDFNALKKILKEGREFGVGTILSTQLLSHFSTSDNDFASYILTWVVHNVANLSTKEVKYIFNTKAKSEEEELYNRIKSLSKHYSLVKMGNNDKAIYLKDKAFWELDK